MAHSLRLADGVNRSFAHRASTPRLDDRRHGAVSSQDERLARLTGANLFIVGDAGDVARLVVSLSSCLAAPIVTRHHGEPLRLPPISRPVGTLIVRDVDTLTRQEQQELSEWIVAGDRHTRVLSSASRFLLPLVETGAFDGALYYRLNVLTLDLTSPVTR